MNQKVASAQSDFERAREDYRHSRQTDLDEIDAKIAKLEAKATTATGKAKADLDARIPQIRAQRVALGADFRALQGATASAWDDAKARVDKEWDSLKSAVDAASSQGDVRGRRVTSPRANRAHGPLHREPMPRTSHLRSGDLPGPGPRILLSLKETAVVGHRA
jgi:hypothetical protein